MNKYLDVFPTLPLEVKPKLIYLEGNMVVGLVQEDKFIGLAYWDGMSQGYSKYLVFPILEK